jgi:hypothetical protein
MNSPYENQETSPLVGRSISAENPHDYRKGKI